MHIFVLGAYILQRDQCTPVDVGKLYWKLEQPTGQVIKYYISLILNLDIIVLCFMRWWHELFEEGGTKREERWREGHYCTAVHHQSVSNGGHTKVKKRIWHTRTLKFDNLSHHVCSRHIKVLIFLWFLCTYILCKVAQNNLLYLSLTMVTQEGNHGDHANQRLPEMDWIDSILMKIMITMMRMMKAMIMMYE